MPDPGGDQPGGGDNDRENWETHRPSEDQSAARQKVAFAAA
jgi:hypothetical protein